MRRFFGTVVVISNLLAVFVACLVLTQAVLITVGAISRYFLKEPLSWVLEPSTLMLIPIVFLALSYTLLEGAHVRVQLITNRLPRKVGRVLEVVSLGCFLGYSVALLWGSWRLAYYSYSHGFKSGSLLAIPLFPVQVTIPIGVFILCLVILGQIAKILGSGQEGPRSSLRG